MNGGIDESYRGSCVICLEGTDTGIALVESAEFAAAGLIVMGVPEDQALVTIEHYAATELGCESGAVPADDQTWAFRVCERCAANSPKPMAVGLLVTGVPTYGQKGPTQ